MYKKLFFIIVLPLVMAACNKKSTTDNCNSTGVPDAAEIATLQSYITTNSITATQDPGGFFYTIVTPGSGVTPTLSSNVTVRYTGKLLNGTVFDSNTSAAGISFVLSQLIRGWQLGIPLIKKGGSINLYLPPSLAYGCYASGPIPGNSSLIFNIELVDVQ
jgi:FKBP-type peptidyl-prolyl cis-trans isomerase FkpA